MTEVIEVKTQNVVRQEFRTVCANFGEPGHHEHAYQKETFELTKRYAIKMNGSSHPVEVPYRIQTRLISDWEMVNDE